MPVYVSEQSIPISKTPSQSFPIFRYDSGDFVLEDVFYNGNYQMTYTSASATGSSRERTLGFISGFHAEYSRFRAFEIEIGGMVLRDHFTYSGYKTEKNPRGNEVCRVTLFYQPKNIKVEVLTEIDGSGFVVRWLEITNQNESDITVSGLYPMCGILFPEIRGNTFSAEHLRPKYSVGSYFDNHYLGEGEFFWQDIPKGTLKFSFERAVFNPPFYMLRDNVYSQTAVISIETSAMPEAEFTAGGDYMYARHVSDNDHLYFKSGIERSSTYRIVKPNQKVISPKIHFGVSYGDDDICINKFHGHIRKSVKPQNNNEIKYPIEYNHTSYTFNMQIPKERFYQEVDIAAQTGAELFVVDAGWFGSSSLGWHQCRGDWNEHELLNGELINIFEYARTKNLMCGLWIEAEAINFESNLAKEHPEWFIGAYGKRLQNLNLLIPEARSYVYKTIEDAIIKYNLDLYRIDGGLKEPSENFNGTDTEGTAWEYFEILNEVFDELRIKFPHVYFENCSGGGGRSDLAIMRRFDWMQATDNFAPVAQLRTIYGMTYSLAPEQLLSIYGAHMPHQADSDFLARSGIFCRPEFSGVSDDISRINPIWLSSIKHAFDIYKNHIRTILDDCFIYHHTPLESYMKYGDWLVLEISSGDFNKSVTGLFRLENSTENKYIFKPRGIARDKKYKIYFDNSKSFITETGNNLINTGICVFVGGSLMSELIIIEAQE